jgi:hypothetical protein
VKEAKELYGQAAAKAWSEIDARLRDTAAASPGKKYERRNADLELLDGRHVGAGVHGEGSLCLRKAGVRAGHREGAPDRGGNRTADEGADHGHRLRRIVGHDAFDDCRVRAEPAGRDPYDYLSSSLDEVPIRVRVDVRYSYKPAS